MPGVDPFDGADGVDEAADGVDDVAPAPPDITLSDSAISDEAAAWARYAKIAARVLWYVGSELAEAAFFKAASASFSYSSELPSMGMSGLPVTASGSYRPRSRCH